MPTLAQIEDFATTHLRVKGGGHYALDGFEWVREHLWLAVIGFKWWRADDVDDAKPPPDGVYLCESCRKKANTLTEWTWENDTATCDVSGFGEVVWTGTGEHAAENEGCPGLQLSPVLFVGLRLNRRSGKTVGFAALAHSLSFLTEGPCVPTSTYVATAEDQTLRLFDGYFKPMLGDEADDEAPIHDVEIMRTRIDYENGALLDVIATSASGATGLDRSLIGTDECRDFSQKTFGQLTPGVFSTRGWECKLGCWRVQWSPGMEIQRSCPKCGRPTQPWYSCAVAMSSAGEIRGGEHDWFHLIMDSLREVPDRNWHTFDDNKIRNPAVSDAALGGFARVMRRNPETAHIADIEVDGESRAVGTDFVGKATARAAMIRRGNAEGSTRPCIGFMDPSTVDELCSVSLFEDVGAEAGEEPWLHIEQVRVDIWAPKLGRIDNVRADREFLHDVPHGGVDEQVVMPFFDLTLPRFPGLVWFGVDSRGMSWVARFLAWARQQPWGRGRVMLDGESVHKIDGRQRKNPERRTAFQELEQRIEGRAGARGRHPPGKKSVALLECNQTLHEFGIAQKKKDTHGQTDVIERTSRRKGHLDVIDTAAMACFGAHKLSVTQTRDGELAALNTPSELSRVLARLRKPLTAGMTHRRGKLGVDDY